MASTPTWSLQVDTDRVAWLICDTPGSSTNVLSAAVMQDLAVQLTEIESLRPAAVVIRSAKASGFIAGADIKEFAAIGTPEEGYLQVRAGQAVLEQLAQLPCPSVAALHGFVLGGGLELSLACTYRVGADDDSLTLGFPEVLLGIHPGFGGTVRAVRMIGVRPAFDLMLKGKSYNGRRALKAGLIDELVPPGDLWLRAKARALRPGSKRSAPFVERIFSFTPLRPFIASRAVSALQKRVRRDHYPAPYAIVDLWRRNGAASAASFAAEARSISELMCSPTSRNLVRLFLLQDRLKGMGSESVADFRHVHVIGAGVMGADIAAWAAFRGMTVTLQDRSEELLQPAMDRAKAFLDKRLSDPTAAAAAFARLRMDVVGRGVAEADVVIEAIFENLDAKRALYAVLEPQLKPGAILATNTSSIKIEFLCEELADPSRLVGIHFFNPVAQLQLVEVVRGIWTQAKVAQDALKFTRKLAKLPLPCRSAPGFVVNRILTPYVNEALFALEGGIPAAVIDRSATDFGMPMGPIELTDVVGLDVSLHVGRVLGQAFNRRVPDILVRLVQQKKLGRKTGEGFYLWREGKPERIEAPHFAAPADLEDRLILPMLNEAVACLREGVVEDADLLDAGAVFATGFAPFRGGPLQYAKARGIENVTTSLRALEKRYGERFRPDAGWQTVLDSM